MGLLGLQTNTSAGRRGGDDGGGGGQIPVKTVGAADGVQRNHRRAGDARRAIILAIGGREQERRPAKGARQQMDQLRRTVAHDDVRRRGAVAVMPAGDGLAQGQAMGVGVGGQVNGGNGGGHAGGRPQGADAGGKVQAILRAQAQGAQFRRLDAAMHRAGRRPSQSSRPVGRPAPGREAVAEPGLRPGEPGLRGAVINGGGGCCLAAVAGEDDGDGAIIIRIAAQREANAPGMAH